MPQSLDPESFEQTVNSEEALVVDFWAEWCGPCKKLAPVFKEVSEEMGDVNFGKVDMEEHQELGTQNGVRALPTLMIFKDGEEIARKSGVVGKEDLVDWIQENI